MIFSGVTSLCAQQVFDKGIEVNGASSFNGNVHVNENGAMKISLSPSEGMGRVKCGELYLQKNGASDTYYDPYISFQYDTYNSRWYLGSKVYDKTPGSRSNGPLYMDVSELDVDGQLKVSDSARFDGYVGMGSLSLRGGSGDSLDIRLNKTTGAWNFFSSSTMRVNANNLGVVGGSFFLENNSGNSMVSLNTDGGMLGTKLFLRRDGASAYMSPSLSIMYNSDASSWEIFPSSYTKAPGTSGTIPAPLNMNVSKLTVAGDAAFTNKADFEDTVKIHRHIYLHNTPMISLDQDGYRSFELSPSGMVNATRNITLFSKCGSNAYYPGLKMTGEGDLSTATFSISTRLSTPSGVYYYPLDLTAKNFGFHGNSVAVKKLGSDSTMINLSEDGTVSAGGLKLLHGCLDADKNPQMDIQYSEDDSAWRLGVTGADAKSSAPLTMDVQQLNVNGPIVCKNRMKVAEVETDMLRTKDVTVDMDHAADYVFDEDYDLKSLDEVEAFVKENKHLPGIPSASKMKEEGMSLSEMSNLLLEKVEELTLHLIRVEKENRALKAEMERMRNEK